MKQIFNSLRNKLGSGLVIHNETADRLDCGIRYWGKWESDDVLSDESVDRMCQIFGEVYTKYPAYNIHFEVNEKNWIDFLIIKTI